MPNEYRNYTLAELELLQNLPVGYTHGVSTSQARKLIGNGWTVDVIAHILGQIDNKKTKELTLFKKTSCKKTCEIKTNRL